MNVRGIFPRSLSAHPSVHSIVDAITTASFYKVSFLIVLSSPRKFRRASLLEYAPETGSCRCRWTFGGKEGRKGREKKGDRGEKGGGLSHQGRNTRTRWYGKPIIIVFTRQQRAAIKNCLFIQAWLFSIRSHTSDRSRECMCVRARVRARPYHPARFFGLPNRCFQFSPGASFSSLRGAGPPEKKLPVTSAIAEEGLKSGAIAASRVLDRSRESSDEQVARSFREIDDKYVG